MKFPIAGPYFTHNNRKFKWINLIHTVCFFPQLSMDLNILYEVGQVPELSTMHLHSGKFASLIVWMRILCLHISANAHESECDG